MKTSLAVPVMYARVELEPGELFPEGVEFRVEVNLSLLRQIYIKAYRQGTSTALGGAVRVVRST